MMNHQRPNPAEAGIDAPAHAHSTHHPDAALRTPALRQAFRGALPATWTEALQSGVAVLVAELARWRPWIDQAAAMVDSNEAARILSRRQQRHRDDLALAYALHRLAVGEAMQVHPAQVSLHRDQRGRPWLSNCALHTSLSHGDGHVAIALTALGATGVDIELASRSGELLEIADLVCAPAELEEARGSSEPAMSLLRTWVRKEALLKAAGVGLSRAMHEFAVPEGVPLPLHAHGDERVSVHMLDVEPGCVAAVAVPVGAAVRLHCLNPPEPGSPLTH